MEVGNAKEGGTCSPPRQRFYIELKPGETTVVSWKKLLKDAAANKEKPSRSNNQTAAAAAAASAVVMEPASVETAQLEPQFALGQPAEPILENKPSSSRVGSVIEKIEQLYVGNRSSEEEELDGVPDEDQYDTEDSFIDDTELVGNMVRMKMIIVMVTTMSLILTVNEVSPPPSSIFCYYHVNLEIEMIGEELQ